MLYLLTDVQLKTATEQPEQHHLLRLFHNEYVALKHRNICYSCHCLSVCLLAFQFVRPSIWLASPSVRPSIYECLFSYPRLIMLPLVEWMYVFCLSPGPSVCLSGICPVTRGCRLKSIVEFYYLRGGVCAFSNILRIFPRWTPFPL